MFVEELPWQDPVALLAVMADIKGTILLHGGDMNADMGDEPCQAAGADAHVSWGDGWSVLVTTPYRTMLTTGRKTTINDKQAEGNPFDLLKGQLANRRFHRHPKWPISDLPAPGFLTGAIGYLSYEMAEHCHPTLPVSQAPRPVPDMVMGFYDASLCFHRASKRCFLVGRKRKAAENLQRIFDAGLQKEKKPVRQYARQSVAPKMNKTSYQSAVKAIRDHIEEGDLFQANMTMPYKAVWSGGELANIAMDYFTRQSRQSDAPFAAYLGYQDYFIVSNSPESFLNISQQKKKLLAQCAPIKGTSARYTDPKNDLKSARNLLVSDKDRAENIMIVDLLRNDLSRSCEDDSVRVTKTCELQSFRRVHHLVSQVEGVLRDDVTAVDALERAFPCGSVTGAPKERAMEILLTKETAPRSVYCGAIGYFDDRGGAGFSVPIRTTLFTQGKNGPEAQYGAGGGITLLSEPEAEYREVLLKAAGFMELVKG
jgi:para-aminobenzoate synthetase component I